MRGLKPAERRVMRRDEDGALHRVVRFDGMDGFVARWTVSCSGCFETGDYGSGAHLYPFDEKARCHIGAGCSECGYTGKRVHRQWIPFDMDAHSEREERRERRRARWFSWLRSRRVAS